MLTQYSCKNGRAGRTRWKAGYVGILSAEQEEGEARRNQ